MNPNLYDVLTMRPPGEMWDYVRNIPNEPSKCNQWKHFHQMLSEHLKCFLPLPTGYIVRKMHMNSLCTQHVITGFQVPLPPVISPAPSPIGPQEIEMSYPSPMPLPTSSLGQSWLSLHHSDDHFFILQSTHSLGCTFGSHIRRDFWHLTLEDFQGIASTALGGRDETAIISNSINHV